MFSQLVKFFRLLKSELLYLREFSSMEEFKPELKKYIWYYNNKKLIYQAMGLMLTDRFFRLIYQNM